MCGTPTCIQVLGGPICWHHCLLIYCLSCRRPPEAACGAGSPQGLWHRFCRLSAGRGSRPSPATSTGRRCHQTRAEALPHSLSYQSSHSPYCNYFFIFVNLLLFFYMIFLPARWPEGLLAWLLFPSRQLCCGSKSGAEGLICRPWKLRAQGFGGSLRTHSSA